MSLSALLRYPVKSMRAEALQSETLLEDGLRGDRRFMVINAAGVHQTQRELPRMATLEAKVVADGVGGEYLELHAPGTSPFNASVRATGTVTAGTLFGDGVLGVDQGRKAGEWLGKLLGNELDRMPLRGLLPIPPTFRLLRAPDRGGSPRRWLHGGMADQAPLLLLCDESLADLNTRRAASGQPPVGMDRFRPNLVVRGCPGPHAEDGWKRVRIGQAEMEVVSPCPRCTVPDVGQSSGVRDSAAVGPMRSLGAYRSRPGKGVLFGVYLAPLTVGARINVGDAVTVLA